MRYQVTIINSKNTYDYWENSADGITYFNLEGEEAQHLIEMALKQDFSAIIQRYEEEE